MTHRMRHVKQWLRFWAKCAASTWLVHTASGLGWLQAMACVALFLLAGIEAVHVLEMLLRAYVADPEDDGGEGPETEPPIVITTISEAKPGYREWRN